MFSRKMIFMKRILRNDIGGHLISTMKMIILIQSLTNEILIELIFNSQICDALRDLVPFEQFKKRENHPWTSVTLSKVAGSAKSYFKATLTKVTLLHGCFSCFFKFCK